jgi:hypothetical protein
VLPKASLAGKPSAHQQSQAHYDLEDEDYIGGARSGGFKECFYQRIVSEQTANCISFEFR